MNLLPKMKLNPERVPTTRRIRLNLNCLTLSGAALLLLLLAGCGGGGSEQPPQPPADVETVIVATAPVEDRVSAVGTIYPNEEVVLMPKVAGRVKEIKFDEGQKVNSGSALFLLDDATEQALLKQAQAELDLAKQNLERSTKLADTRAISVQELDRLASELSLKEAQVHINEERAADMRLSAPLNGVVGPREVSVGQYVSVGQPLVTLTDSSKVKISYRLPESHAALLKPGQQVVLKISAYEDREFPATVDLINPQVDAATRTIEVRAIAANEDGALKPGMFARVETVTGRREEAVVIPERAVIPSLSGFAVYVVTNKQVRLMPVELGMRMPGKVEVRKGLKPGEEIVVNGVQKVVDGAAVAPTPAPPMHQFPTNQTATAG
jgi:membrane fusion protein (multidrug efflux system)